MHSEKFFNNKNNLQNVNSIEQVLENVYLLSLSKFYNQLLNYLYFINAFIFAVILLFECSGKH